MNEIAFVAFGFALVIALFWFVSVATYSLRLAETRQRLFELRDTLFDLGKEGVVPFHSPAYRISRDMINAMIRFAHDLSFIRLIVIAVTNRKMSAEQISFSDAIKQARAQLSTEGQREFDQVQDWIRYWSTVHVLKGSIAFIVLVSIAVVIIGLKNFVQGCFSAVSSAARMSAEAAIRLSRIYAPQDRRTAELFEVADRTAHALRRIFNQVEFESMAGISLPDGDRQRFDSSRMISAN